VTDLARKLTINNEIKSPLAD